MTHKKATLQLGQYLDLEEAKRILTRRRLSHVAVDVLIQATRHLNYEGLVSMEIHRIQKGITDDILLQRYCPARRVHCVHEKNQWYACKGEDLGNHSDPTYGIGNTVFDALVNLCGELRSDKKDQFIKTRYI